jgi:putative membrane protein
MHHLVHKVDEKVRMSMMMWGYYGGYSWPMILWMGFWNLLWLVLLGLAVWALVRWLLSSTSHLAHPRPSSNEPTAIEILRQRYARGEIDTATFEQMREHLAATKQDQSVGSY